HGVNDRQVDRELIDLMKARGTTYVSTLAVYEPRGREILTPLLRRVLDPVVLAAIRPPLTPPTGGETIPIPPSNIAPGPETPSRQRRWYNLQNNLGQLNRAGVRIGAGTDAGVVGTHHGWGTIRELELMVAGGMTPLEVLTAATGNSARALGVASERGTIAPGRLADLLIIEGEPHRRINEITRIRHLFLSGREIEREELARQIAMPELTPLPTTPASASLDDFERADNRSTIDTRWVYGSDAGVDPSKVIFGRIARHPNSASLLATARLSIKERPFIRMILPLRRGGVEPVDASKFSGVKFEVRGGGDYRLVIPTYQVRDLNHFAAPFQATSDWTTVTIPFSALRRNDKSPESGPGWTARDLVAIGFEMAGRSGELRWIELDNIRLY
ncbi:MAG: CIA30 family protein, partial [Acidobacteriota bacterium]